jgi:hypothetical protein
LKQNFSKQVFGYFLAAKTDKEKDLRKRILFRKDATPMIFYLFRFSMMISPRCGFFCVICNFYYDIAPLGLSCGYR